MVRGDAIYEAGGRRESVVEGAMALCRPTVRDAWQWDTKRWCRHMYAHFRIESVPVAWAPLEAWPRVREGAGDGLLGVLLSHLVSLAGRGEEEHARRCLRLLVSGFVLGQSDLGAGAGLAMSEPVARATQMIESRLEADAGAGLTLDQLAGAAYVTREHLCRLFRRELGVSPMQAVQHARLDRGLAMLTRSNESVAEIAGRVGFSNPYHFSRRFKAAFGHSPTQLRQAVAGGHLGPLPLRHRHGVNRTA